VAYISIRVILADTTSWAPCPWRIRNFTPRSASGTYRGALDDAASVIAHLAIAVGDVVTITHQAAGVGILAPSIDCGNKGLIALINPRALTENLRHFAGTQAAAIAEAQHDAGLEATGDSQQTTSLVRAHHLRDLLGLAQVIDLGNKIQPPQRHAHQELHPSHDAVAITDAYILQGREKARGQEGGHYRWR